MAVTAALMAGAMGVAGGVLLGPNAPAPAPVTLAAAADDTVPVPRLTPSPDRTILCEAGTWLNDAGDGCEPLPEVTPEPEPEPTVTPVPEPEVTPEPEEVITEEDPRWDCHTMGNLICGTDPEPVTHMDEGILRCGDGAKPATDYSPEWGWWAYCEPALAQ